MPEWIDLKHEKCCPCHTTRKLAYTVEEAAARVGCSTDMLRAHMRQNYLTAKYVNSKPIIPHDELVAWLEALPNEPR